MQANLQEAKRLCDALNIPYREELKGSTLTTMAVGGELFLIQPQSRESLVLIRKEFSNASIPIRILGGGSNLLISDAPLSDPVIQLGKTFKFFEQRHDQWSVGAGTGLMQFSRQVSEAGFSGLEFAGGIPATIGGAVYMNAGAHTGEIADVLNSVEVLLSDGSVEIISRKDLSMKYRSSGLPEGAIVLKAVFDLTLSDKEKTFELLKKNLEYRKKTQPLQLPSFGSVFKNPSPELSAGAVIESLGLKGMRVGGAEVSDLHANWIVNPKKNALAYEVHTLMTSIIDQANASGVELIPEVKRWGEF